MCNTRYCRDVHPDGRVIDYNRIKWCPAVRRGEPCPDAGRPVGSISREVRYVEPASRAPYSSVPVSHLPPTPPRTSPSGGSYYADDYPEGHRLERRSSKRHSNGSGGSTDRSSRRRLSDIFFGAAPVERKPERRRSLRKERTVVVEHEPTTPLSPLPRDHEFSFARSSSFHEPNPFTPVTDGYNTRSYDDADITRHASHRTRRSRTYDDRAAGTIRRRRNSYIEEEARHPAHRYIEDRPRDAPSRRDVDLAEAEILRQRRRAAEKEGFPLSSEPVIRTASPRRSSKSTSRPGRPPYSPPTVQDVADEGEQSSRPVVTRSESLPVGGTDLAGDNDSVIEQRLEIARMRAEILTRKDMEAKALKAKDESERRGRARTKTRVAWDDGSYGYA